MRVSKEQAVVHSLARMYKYADKLTSFCEQNHWDIDDALEDEWNMLAIAKCIEELGEYANNIKRVDEEFYYNESLEFPQIKGMRNVMSHEYYKVSPSAVKDALLHDAPKLREFLVDVIPNELLENPNYIFSDEFDAEEIYHGIFEKVDPSKEKEQDYSMTL